MASFDGFSFKQYSRIEIFFMYRKCYTKFIWYANLWCHMSIKYDLNILWCNVWPTLPHYGTALYHYLTWYCVFLITMWDQFALMHKLFYTRRMTEFVEIGLEAAVWVCMYENVNGRHQEILKHMNSITLTMNNMWSLIIENFSFRMNIFMKCNLVSLSKISLPVKVNITIIYVKTFCNKLYYWIYTVLPIDSQWLMLPSSLRSDSSS